MVRDPVCNMEINEQEAEHFIEYQERTYFFCSEGCKGEFQRHSEDYGGIALPARGEDEDVQVHLLQRQ